MIHKTLDKFEYYIYTLRDDIGESGESNVMEWSINYVP